MGVPAHPTDIVFNTVYDTTLVELCDTCVVRPQLVSIETTETGLEISVFPNPFSKEIFVSIENGVLQHNMQLTVYNILGHRIAEHSVPGADLKIETTNWPAGVYLLEVLNEGHRVGWGKVVKN